MKPWGKGSLKGGFKIPVLLEGSQVVQLPWELLIV